MNVAIPLMLLRAATIVVGALFLGYTVQAYRKHRARSMLWLATAVGLMVLGAAVEAVSFLWLGANLGTAELLEASVTLAAFLVLLASIRMHRA